jgi:hypothetical protein
MKDPNLYYTPQGVRYCRKCRAERVKAYRLKRKLEQQEEAK